MAALLLCAGSLWAQTLEIEKPLALTERQEAVKYERLDFNQVPCALLILHLDNDNVDFEGDIRTTQYRNGEWWIWMIQGSNWLTVKASQFTPLTMEFKGLQSGKTYEATVRAAVLLRLAISEDFHFDQSRTDAANAKYMRRDAQGRTCALVRMGLVLPEAQITGPQVEHSEYCDGEWWVWLSPDATQMTVTADGYQPLALQFDPVRAASTYMLTLLKEGQRAPQRYKWEKVPEGFVDLGLPSSTLWAVENEDALPHRGYLNGDYMNWDDASNFLLPSFEQAKELVNECKWAWTGKGYKVTGPNGNSIDLPALGAYIENWDPEKPVDYREVGMYWTRVPSGQNHAVVLAFNKDSVAIDEGPRDDGYTVRTVKYPPAEKKPQTDNKVYGSEEIGANPQFQGNINEWFRKQRSALGSNDMIGVNFVVESDGRVSDITVLSFSSNGDVETKALGVLKKMPKWKPAMKDGKPVRSVVSLLVDFRTSGSGNQYGDLPEGTIIVDIRDTEVTTKLGNVVATGYVDLGLPSGTLWKSANEVGHYDYNDAVKKFGNNLPTREQWEELKEHCWWVWNEEDETTAAVVGENGNFILLPAEGFFQPPDPDSFIKEDGKIVNEVSGYYWSRTPGDHGTAWYLYFNYDDEDYDKKVKVARYVQSRGHSVRLVKSK